MKNEKKSFSEESYIPVRGVNAHVFCPRLYWLEYVAGEFADNAHTLKGRSVHRRVDRPGGAMDAPEVGPSWHTRSVWLSDQELGISGKIDLVEQVDEGTVMPVDTKKGSPMDDGALWPADRVQLVLQALLLRAHGFECHHVAAWYHSARSRVVEELDEATIAWAQAALAATRATDGEEEPPPPLIDSPKCRGCSLHAICMPDEVNALKMEQTERGPVGLRRVHPRSQTALPLYVSTSGTRVKLSKHEVRIVPPSYVDDEEEKRVGLSEISEINLMGGVQVTTQAMQACLRRGIRVNMLSSSGWYYGSAESTERRQVHVRMGQFEAHGTTRALEVARVLIADKIYNQRVLLRRNSDAGEEVLEELDRLRREAERAEEPAQLLGFEGMAARTYWGAYSDALCRDDERWEMGGRNRRPPEDPANALLSFGYALLVKDCTRAVEGSGMDAYLGMFHTPHHGRPAMALDLMEPFRPLLVDSAILRMIRNGEVSPEGFHQSGQAVAMKRGTKKSLLAAYERRVKQEMTHPVFGYRISYRQVLGVQARLLARVMTGELDEMPAFRTR